MTSCIVTCIYELKRRSPEYFHRSGEEYACMLEYHRRFNVPVYCYTEEDIKDKLPDFVIPIIVPFEDLPSRDLIRTTGKGYDNVMVGDQVHEGHRLYSLVTNSKIFFISMIEEEYDTYVWLDAGIEHGDPVPIHVALETYNNIVDNPKSQINMINYPTEIQLDKNMYNVASGMFSIKKKDISLLLDSYKVILQEVFNMGYICLEEQIFAMLYMKHGRDIFRVSFTDYRVLSNGKYYRTDQTVILRNIYTVPNDIAIEIVNILLESIATGNSRMQQNDLVNCLLHIYIHMRDIRVARMFKHILLYNNYTNNPAYKGRHDTVRIIKQYGITIEYLNYVETCESMCAYLKKYPFERSIITILI